MNIHNKFSSYTNLYNKVFQQGNPEELDIKNETLNLDYNLSDEDYFKNFAENNKKVKMEKYDLRQTKKRNFSNWFERTTGHKKYDLNNDLNFNSVHG